MVAFSYFRNRIDSIVAEAGKRVLIVDADMRRGHLNRFVGTEQAPGLSELIAGKVTLEQAANVITDKLSIIATGERPPNPSELLMSEGFERFIGQASEAYDQVIVVGRHDDAQLLFETIEGRFDAGLVVHQGDRDAPDAGRAGGRQE